MVPPGGLHRPWAGGSTLRHDGDCFDINPLAWFVLAHHGVTVRGPTPDSLGIALDVDERVRFAIDNLIGYWRPLASDVRAACRTRAADDEPTAAFDVESFVWCTLGALRLHRTAFHGDVISVTGAGLYGIELTAADQHPLIDAAIAFRTHGADGAAITIEAMEAAADLIDWVVDDAERAWLEG